MNASKHAGLVLIPAYDAGGLLEGTVREALAQWQPVWVVDDGSTDGSVARLAESFAGESRPRVIALPENRGKGAALRAGAQRALREGYTHALTMDADGQHDAASIPRFMEASRANPDALIMGSPLFSKDAPWSRVWGRKLNIFWTDLETGFCGLGDTLFGFRVYPLGPLCRVMEQMSWGRGFDFDPEVAVRLRWEGLRPRQLETPVRYIPSDSGGISHFHYLRDNALLTWLHFRLLPECILRKTRLFR